MATESYGRCDDGVHWIIYHELPLGQWWWMIHPDGGERIDSPRRYATEGQALAAVEAARAAVVAGRPVVETMESLRARAEAAEARAAQAEADARLMLTMLVDLDVSEGTNVVRHWQDLGLTDAERDVLWSCFARTPPGVEEWEIEAVRRILAAGGAA